MDCGMKCVRMLLFVFNFLFWAMGVLLLVIGVMGRTSSSNWKEMIQDTFVLNAANIIIAAGVIVGLIGFLGCCGALKKSKCMLYSFAVTIGLIFCLEIGGGIYAYTKKDQLEKDFNEGLDAVQKEYGKGNAEFDKAIDWIQQNVECCGTTNSESWQRSDWYKNNTKTIVPESCCVKQKAGCNKESDLKIFKKGCAEKGKDYVKSQIVKIAGAAIGIAVVQLLGIVFACCLSRAIDKEA